MLRARSHNGKTRRMLCHFLLLFCIGYRVSALDDQQFNKIRRNLLTRIHSFDSPGEKEVKSPAEVHVFSPVSGEEVPKFEEIEFEDRLSPSRGTSSNNDHHGSVNSRRVRKSVDGTKEIAERTHWCALASVVFIGILILVVFLAGKGQLLKWQDAPVPENPLSTPVHDTAAQMQPGRRSPHVTPHGTEIMDSAEKVSRAGGPRSNPPDPSVNEATSRMSSLTIRDTDNNQGTGKSKLLKDNQALIPNILPSLPVFECKVHPMQPGTKVFDGRSHGRDYNASRSAGTTGLNRSSSDTRSSIKEPDNYRHRDIDGISHFKKHPQPQLLNQGKSNSAEKISTAGGARSNPTDPSVTKAASSMSSLPIRDTDPCTEESEDQPRDAARLPPPQDTVITNVENYNPSRYSDTGMSSNRTTHMEDDADKNLRAEENEDTLRVAAGRPPPQDILTEVKVYNPTRYTVTEESSYRTTNTEEDIAKDLHTGEDKTRDQKPEILPSSPLYGCTAIHIQPGTSSSHGKPHGRGEDKIRDQKPEILPSSPLYGCTAIHIQPGTSSSHGKPHGREESEDSMGLPPSRNTLKTNIENYSPTNDTVSKARSSGRMDTEEDMDKNLHAGENQSIKRHRDPSLEKKSRTVKRSRKLSLEPLPKAFLQKLMALDVSARNTGIQDGDLDLDTCLDFKELKSNDMSLNSSNPLDVICNLLCSSDSILQQNIVSKMSMCQFAVPLLLPPGDGSGGTFMLWAMRDIVKRWRPQSLADSKGFKEDSLVNIPMPVFSFVRLGNCNLSKSRLLNQVLSPPQQDHNYFVHSDMPGGNIPRKLSNGLLEISWYFPAGQEHLDTFSDPIAVINLRGDLESNQEQVNFLTRASSAVYIFLETINDRQHKLLSELQLQNQQVFLIWNVGDEKSNAETIEFLKDLSTKNLRKENILVKKRNMNDSQLVRKLQSTIKAIIANTTETLNLEQIAEQSTKFNIHVDEHSPECSEAKIKAMEITGEIKNVAQYKKETMKLQGEQWKQLVKKEKELCRLRELGERDAEEYKSQLRTEISRFRQQQSQQHLTNGMKKFLEAVTLFSPVKRNLFLKWLKMKLDTIGRCHLTVLHNEYRDKCRNLSTSADDLKEIDQKIVDGSLGVEHFLHELGQFYELKCSMVETKREFVRLPGIAADLLLDGFPLELIDGDASNIPLQWITDVLTELDTKTGGQCRMRVITVLGVQSTGKSTLLNTMFGLQFPVASGRCTRGAFMTLINVEQNVQEELDCDYILVIDTEGLKSLELASLEGSYEHDNELATLVVGLSDITIVNMAMENTEEMRDILQVVVHAFLRMKEIGKKSSCQFVHQNVSDVSAHVKNRNARQKFIEQLNEMTKVAARMEKRSGVTAFSNIIYCDLEKHSWYIPGLWHGMPPMASVNFGYSESINELKTSIISSLQTMPGKPQNIGEFAEWIKSLWNAVKHEKFVFSFRNHLVTEAYNQLCIQYSDWEWRFQKNIHSWIIKTETLIYNLPYDKLGADAWKEIQNEMYQLLEKEERNMSQSLQEYFEGDYGNAHLLEMFRGDFFRSVRYLRKELETLLTVKCEKTLRIQEEKCKIQAMQERYIDIIEEKVAEIMDTRRNTKYLANIDQISKEFEIMWEKTVSSLQLSKLEKRNIGHEILQQLKQDIKCDDKFMTEKLHNLSSLHDCKENSFAMNEVHLFRNSTESWNLAEHFASSLLNKCNDYVTSIASTNKDFNEMYSQELLKMINEGLSKHDARYPQTTKFFESDLKLNILVSAALKFQKMHDDFVQKNDPNSCLELLKPQYFCTFRNIFEKRNECQRRAEQFCDLCLKPAIADHINKYLGKEIVDDILQTRGPQEFKSKTLFQSLVLETLLTKKSCHQYAEYINNYERFIQGWISQYIVEHYRDMEHIKKMQVHILKSLMAKIRKALDDSKVLQAEGVPDFLAKFCHVLKKEMVISQNNMKVVIFQSNLDIKQFAVDIGSYLCDLEEQICQAINSVSIESVLSQLTLKPQDELFRKVIGCGKQCPFCKVPCEAGGGDHKEHFASVHRPRGLGQYQDKQTKVLDHSICSTNVITNKSFSNGDTAWKPHPYKDYQTYYPDWAIYPDTAADASDYWKFVLKEFNDSFAKLYKAKPAHLPQDWYRLTEDQALNSLKTTLK